MRQVSHDQITELFAAHPPAAALYESLRAFYGEALLIEEQTPDENQSMSGIDLDGATGRLRMACVRPVLSGDTFPAALAHELLHLP